MTDRDFTPQFAAQIPDLFTAWTQENENGCADIAFGRTTAAERAFFCSRLKDHTGRHAAGDTITILATWR